MSDQTDSQQNVTNLVATLTSLVLALIVGAVALYSAWKAGKEKAKLLHERDVESERQVQAVTDANEQEGVELVIEAMERVEAHEARIETLNAGIAAAEAQHATAVAKITSLTSWDSFQVVRK